MNYQWISTHKVTLPIKFPYEIEPEYSASNIYWNVVIIAFKISSD